MTEIEKEIFALYEQLKDVKAVRKSYNREKTKKRQVSLGEVERILAIGRDDADSVPLIVMLIIVCIFVSSLMHLFVLFTKQEWYWELHGHLTEPWVTLRYLFSLFQRVVGLSIGIGVLLRKELCRKAILGLGIFSICVLPWKHSYQGFVEHTAILDEKYADMLMTISTFSGSQFSFSAITVPAMLAHWLADASFWCLVFWVMTRPSIKAIYRKNRGDYS